MALRHVDVTLSGSTQVTATRIPVQQVLVHNPAGNGTITLGDSTLSATSYGILVGGGATSPDIGPFSSGAPLNLNELYIRGTDTNIVHVLYVTH